MLLWGWGRITSSFRLFANDLERCYGMGWYGMVREAVTIAKWFIMWGGTLRNDRYCHDYSVSRG